MRVFGVDFTSAPQPAKPITCAVCQLEDGLLELEGLEAWTDFSSFEAFLRRPGSWVAGLDFPFGLPRGFLDEMGTVRTWSGYVNRLARLGRAGFRERVHRFKAPRPAGQKDLRRVADRLARAASPLNVTRPPVGLMFLEGAPRLAAAPVSVLPVRPRQGRPVVLEAYPALVARALLGHAYKAGAAGGAGRRARRALLARLGGAGAGRLYGVMLVRPAPRWTRMLLEDPRGDHLDALLAAVQAAWALGRPARSYGMPAQPDRLEGWIADPALAGAGRPG